MQLECDKRDVRTVAQLSDALPMASAINRCIWVQVEERNFKLYKVYPTGRVIDYTIKVPWTKGRPEALEPA